MSIRAVGAIVYRIKQNQLEVLLIKKRGGYWTLPKGKVEPGEDDESAVLRELREETGLKGIVVDMLSQADYEIVKGGQTLRKQVVYYLVLANGGELQASAAEKIIRIRWMTIPRALERIGRPRIRAVLQAAQTMFAA